MAPVDGLRNNRNQIYTENTFHCFYVIILGMTRDKMYKELGKLSSEGAFKTKYEKVELLGEGGAGKVYMTKNKVECDHVSTAC